jgi:hypothetical protein
MHRPDQPLGTRFTNVSGTYSASRGVERPELVSLVEFRATEGETFPRKDKTPCCALATWYQLEPNCYITNAGCLVDQKRRQNLLLHCPGSLSRIAAACSSHRFETAKPSPKGANQTLPPGKSSKLGLGAQTFEEHLSRET